MSTVVFYVGPQNTRSQRAMEKIGGVRDPEPDVEGRLCYCITARAFADS